MKNKKIKKLPFYGLLIITMLVGGWFGSVFAAVSINESQIKAFKESK